MLAYKFVGHFFCLMLVRGDEFILQGLINWVYNPL